MNPSLPQAVVDPDRVNGKPLHHTLSSDFLSQPPSGAMPMNGHAPMPVPRPQMGNGMRGFDGPRSPPNSKSWWCLGRKVTFSNKPDSMADIASFPDTSHVPCKFYRQGTCQAGKACPFLHSEDVGICKYFQKVSHNSHASVTRRSYADATTRAIASSACDAPTSTSPPTAVESTNLP